MRREPRKTLRRHGRPPYLDPALRSVFDRGPADAHGSSHRRPIEPGESRRSAGHADPNAGPGARRDRRSRRLHELPRTVLRALPALGLHAGSELAGDLRLRPARTRRVRGGAAPRRGRTAGLDRGRLEQHPERRARSRSESGGHAGDVGGQSSALRHRSSPGLRHRLFGRGAGGGASRDHSRQARPGESCCCGEGCRRHRSGRRLSRRAARTAPRSTARLRLLRDSRTPRLQRLGDDSVGGRPPAPSARPTISNLSTAATAGRR